MDLWTYTWLHATNLYIYICTHDTPISMHLCDHSVTCVCVRLLCICIYIYIQGGAPKIAKLVNITPITMVHRWYTELVCMGFLHQLIDIYIYNIDIVVECCKYSYSYSYSYIPIIVIGWYIYSIWTSSRLGTTWKPCSIRGGRPGVAGPKEQSGEMSNLFGEMGRTGGSLVLFPKGDGKIHWTFPGDHGKMLIEWWFFMISDGKMTFQWGLKQPIWWCNGV